MEISVSKVSEEKSERVHIECHQVTAQVNSIVKFVKSLTGTLTGKIDDRSYEVNIVDIYYIESVDNRSYIYTKDKVFLASQRLYEIEEMLKDASFIRISKAVIVNLMKIKTIKPALNGRFSAFLVNGEEVIISRKYVPDFKEKIKGGKQL